MARKYIFEQWNGFRESQLSSDIPDLEYEILKETFFAGSLALLRILLGHMDGSEADQKLLADVKKELLEFIRTVTDANRFDPDSFKLPTM